MKLFSLLYLCVTQSGLHSVPARRSSDLHGGLGGALEGLEVAVGEGRDHHPHADLEARARAGFQVGVRVVVPPFPYRDLETFQSTSKAAVKIGRASRRDRVEAALRDAEVQQRE